MLAVSQTAIYVGVGVFVVAAFIVVVISDSLMAKRRVAQVTKFAGARGLTLALANQPVPEPQFSLFRRQANDKWISEQMSYPGSDDSVFVFTARTRSASGEHNEYFQRVCALIALPVEAPPLRIVQHGLLASTGVARGSRKVEKSQNFVELGEHAFDSEFKISAESSQIARDVLSAEITRWLLDEAASGREIGVELRGHWMLCDLGRQSAELDERLGWFEWARDAGKRFGKHLELRA